jgi:predicted PurR-regulated permease PerM
VSTNVSTPGTSSTPSAPGASTVSRTGNAPGRRIAPTPLREALDQDSLTDAASVPVDPTTRANLQTFFLGGLFFFALFAALHAASSIILPTVLAFLLKLLLQPLVRLFERIHVPRQIGAALVIVLAAGALGGLVAALSVPASAWTARLPQVIPRVEEQLVVLTKPLGAVQKVLQRAEQVAEPAGPKPVAVVRDSNLGGAVFEGVKTIVDGLFTTVLVLYFLLVAGDTFLRRLVEVLPRLSDKKQAVEISQHIEADMSVYLVTVTVMNALVGIATGIAMYFCDLGDPVLWGFVAFLLNYIPIMGPVFATAIFFVAALVIFDDARWAFLPPALYFVIHVIEGETLTPMLIARRFTLNPVLIILSLVFWFWMWGVPGVILAVPMLAILKIVCDRVRPLMPLGHFLGG